MRGNGGPGRGVLRGRQCEFADDIGGAIRCRPPTPSLAPEDLDVVDPVLRDELLEMRRADQTERTGEGLPPGTKLPPIQDYARTDRLKENQRYGTQVRCRAGQPRPATPLVDPAGVDDLRSQVGLAPLDVYYGELALMCANEEAEGLETGD